MRELPTSRVARTVAFAAMLVVTGIDAPTSAQTIGGGTVENPAVGPRPTFGVGEGENYVLVKNWDFGYSSGNTVRNGNDMSANFQYHDQFGTIANGTKYGAYIVAPNVQNSLTNLNQPIEGVNTDRPVRQFTQDSLKTYIVPLDGATQVHPQHEKAGSGAFQAKWTLPNGGSLLGKSMVWETRVRYETPPYFWFSIWTAGNQWDGGAEIDVIESFGYNNGGGFTNYDGDYWHSSSVGGHDDENYHQGSWRQHMEARGIYDFDATAWHTWTLEYRDDDTFSTYVDGIEVQSGGLSWTRGGGPTGNPINMSFIFDGTWGHRQVSSVNHWLDASELEDVYYEWDYSRVYLKSEGIPGDYNADGSVDAADYSVWRDSVGQTAGTLPNDVDGGVIGTAQYDTWAANFGSTSSAAGETVPEPTAVGMALMALMTVNHTGRPQRPIRL